jgi:hypothetical protein
MRYIFLLLSFTISLPSYAITIGEIVNPAEEFLECKDLQWYEKVVCEIAAEKFYGELNSRGISLSNGAVLFTLSPMVTPRKVDTGHSCTHKMWIQDNYLNGHLASSGTLDLKGNSLSEPLILYTDLPIDMSAVINLKEQWGNRIWFGGCNKHASDTYKAKADISTNITTRILVSLEPKLDILENGDYLITIAPISNVRFSLPEVDFDYRFSGRSPFNGLLTLMSNDLLFFGPIALTFTIFEAAVEGDSIGDELEQKLKTAGADLVLGSFQTISELDVPLLVDELEDMVQEAALDKIYGAAEGFEMQLQKSIDAEIARALNLDSQGKREILIPKEKIDVTKYIGIFPAIQLVLG